MHKKRTVLQSFFCIRNSSTYIIIYFKYRYSYYRTDNSAHNNITRIMHTHINPAVCYQCRPDKHHPRYLGIILFQYLCEKNCKRESIASMRRDKSVSSAAVSGREINQILNSFIMTWSRTLEKWLENTRRNLIRTYNQQNYA